MSIPNTSITAADLAGKGNAGMPDTPGLSAEKMQQKLDELSLEVLVPKHNALVNALGEPQAAAAIATATGESIESRLARLAGESLAGDMKRAVYDPAGSGAVLEAQNGFAEMTHSAEAGVNRLRFSPFVYATAATGANAEPGGAVTPLGKDFGLLAPAQTLEFENRRYHAVVVRGETRFVRADGVKTLYAPARAGEAGLYLEAGTAVYETLGGAAQTLAEDLSFAALLGEAIAPDGAIYHKLQVAGQERYLAANTAQTPVWRFGETEQPLRLVTQANSQFSALPGATLTPVGAVRALDVTSVAQQGGALYYLTTLGAFPADQALELHLRAFDPANIRFNAAADCPGPLFYVNGRECAAKIQTGAALGLGAFVAGAAVACYANGNTLNFNAGSGNSGFAVVTANSAALLPENAAPNTIGLLSDTPAGRFAIALENPFADPQPGDLWIRHTRLRAAAVSITDDASVSLYPGNALQYINGAWAPRRYCYRTKTGWALAPITFYAYGDECRAAVGSWTRHAAAATAPAKQPEYLSLLHTNTTYGSCASAVNVDCSDITTLYANLYFLNTSTGTAQNLSGQFGITAAKSVPASYIASASIVPTQNPGAVQTVSVDVSGFGGNAYVAFYTAVSAAQTAEFRLYEVWGV